MHREDQTLARTQGQEDRLGSLQVSPGCIEHAERHQGESPPAMSKESNRDDKEERMVA